MKDRTIQIDSAGRVVLPKPLRKHFNLLPGDKLRLSSDSTGIRLEPADAAGHLVRKGKVLVFTGEFSEPVTSEMIQKTLDEDRERGVRELAGKLRKK
jgi:AbrB family looped-hinge helix DNA binding protein